MRISYTYQKYPNCPRATEYSQSAEYSAAYGSILVGPLSIGAVIEFLICTFSFFGNYNWGEFLGAIAFTIVVSIIDFYFFVIRPNNTQCEIKVILVEDGNHNLPSSVLQQFCENLRKENRKTNTKAFTRFFLVFLVSLSGAIALIAAIKGVYFLCHKEGGLFLLLGGILVIGVLAYLLWRLLSDPTPKPATTPVPVSKEPPETAPRTSESGDIAFCRKCGTKVLSDSVFCAKCGTKVR